jgi:hypothetical protein
MSEYTIVSSVILTGAEYERLTARVKALEEALTPSGETKAAYIGEFCFEEETFDDEGDEVVRKIAVPWTTVKEIMAAIKARVLLTPAPEKEEE